MKVGCWLGQIENNRGFREFVIARNQIKLCAHVIGNRYARLRTLDHYLGTAVAHGKLRPSLITVRESQ